MVCVVGRIRDLILQLSKSSIYSTKPIYADYKTRWPAMADVSESVVVGQKIDNISLDEFAKALKSVLARI